jgi:hypothetical protein
MCDPSLCTWWSALPSLELGAVIISSLPCDKGRTDDRVVVAVVVGSKTGKTPLAAALKGNDNGSGAMAAIRPKLGDSDTMPPE